MGQWRCLLLCVLAVAAHQGVTALYEPNDDVVVLTSANFDRVVLSSPGAAAVEFYAPWCGHCKALAPQWKKAATNVKGLATIAAVDCDDQANRPLCSKYGIQGFPTVKLFGPDFVKDPESGVLSKQPQDYLGPRTARGVVDALLALYTDLHVAQLPDEAAVGQFVDTPADRAKVVLVTEKQEVTVLYKSLSTQLHKGVDFAQVHGPSVPSAAQVLGMAPDAPLPALAIVKPGGGIEQYQGVLKAPQLKEQLLQYAPELAAALGEAKVKPPPPKADFKKLTVLELQQLDDVEDMWLVALQWGAAEGDPEHSCVAKTQQLHEVVSELNGVMQLGLVNITSGLEMDQVARYGAGVASMRQEKTRPGICAQRLVLLPYGPDKAEYHVYPGELEGKALYKWATSLIPSTFTQEVTASTMQQFAATVRPPAEGDEEDDAASEDGEDEALDQFARAMRDLPPKVLLFTNKDEPAPLYRALAMNMRKAARGMLFGWLRANMPNNQVVLEQLKQSKVPGIVMLLPMPKEVEGPDGKKSIALQLGAQPFTGPTTYKAMADWVQQMLLVLEQLQGIAKTLPVPELRSPEDLATHCVDKGAGVCIIGLLDCSSSAKSRRTLTKLLGRVAAQRSAQPLHFSWVDATKHRAFAADAGVLQSDLPAVVALSAKKLMVSVMAEPLATGYEGERAMGDFIDAVLAGKARTHTLQALPRVMEGAPGSEAAAAEGSHEEVAEPVAEEFDLNDILNEEVEGGEVLLSKEERLRQVEEELQKQEQESKKKDKKKKKKKKSKKKKAKAADKEEL